LISASPRIATLSIKPSGSSMTPAAYGSRAFVITNGGSLLGLHVEPPI